MKIIVAGSRDFSDYAFLSKKLDALGRKDIIVSGMAKGADLLAHQYAKEHNMEIIEMKANWKKYGRAAGPIRNREMAKIADALIAFWDGKSKGTKNMIDTMNKLKKAASVYLIESAGSSIE
ncbi:MAG: DUF2493 domain-containing protein [Elusimicrobiota bacterium]|jgi:hypothetical protein|nr:DUF2493 domain-containing protein [Elusimicrobiota bacterium]